MKSAKLPTHTEIHIPTITATYKGGRMKEPNASINTDVEIWKQSTTNYGKEDGNDKGMEPSVFVTEQGGVGFNHYGTCAVKTIKEWIELTKTYRPTQTTDEVIAKFREEFSEGDINEAPVFHDLDKIEAFLRDNLPVEGNKQ